MRQPFDNVPLIPRRPCAPFPFFKKNWHKGAGQRHRPHRGVDLSRPGSCRTCTPTCSSTCWPCERFRVIVGEHQGQSALPILTTCESSLQRKHAAPIQYLELISLENRRLTTHQMLHGRDILCSVQALAHFSKQKSMFVGICWQLTPQETFLGRDTMEG